MPPGRKAEDRGAQGWAIIGVDEPDVSGSGHPDVPVQSFLVSSIATVAGMAAVICPNPISLRGRQLAHPAVMKHPPVLQYAL